MAFLVYKTNTSLIIFSLFTNLFAIFLVNYWVFLISDRKVHFYFNLISRLEHVLTFSKATNNSKFITKYLFLIAIKISKYFRDKSESQILVRKLYFKIVLIFYCSKLLFRKLFQDSVWFFLQYKWIFNTEETFVTYQASLNLNNHACVSEVTLFFICKGVTFCFSFMK